MDEWLDKLVVVNLKVNNFDEIFIGIVDVVNQNGNFIVLTNCYKVYNLSMNDFFEINKSGTTIITKSWVINKKNTNSFKEYLSEKIDIIQLFNISKILPCSDILKTDLEKDLANSN